MYAGSISSALDPFGSHRAALPGILCGLGPIDLNNAFSRCDMSRRAKLSEPAIP
jgi:hypothetical protein